MSKKIILIIIIGIFIGGVFAGGTGVYFLAKPKQAEQPELTKSKQAEQPEGEKITYLNETDGYALKIPKEWIGKYQLKEEGNTVRFLYLPVKDELKYNIFSITVYSQNEWEETEKERKEAEEKGLAPGCCPRVLTKDETRGRVFIYNTPLDVPYDEQVDIDEFGKMVGQVQEIIASFSLSN